MNTDIRKIVNDLVEGLIMLLYQYLGAMFNMIIDPFNGSLSLAGEYLRDPKNYFSPYLSLFLSYTISFVLSFALDTTFEFQKIFSKDVQSQAQFTVLLKFFCIVIAIDLFLKISQKIIPFIKINQRLRFAIQYLFSLHIIVFSLIDSVFYIAFLILKELNKSDYLYDMLVVIYSHATSFLKIFIIGIPIGFFIIRKKKLLKIVPIKPKLISIFILFIGFFASLIIGKSRKFFYNIGTEIYYNSFNSLGQEMLDCRSRSGKLTAQILIKNNSNEYRFLEENFATIHIKMSKPVRRRDPSLRFDLLNFEFIRTVVTKSSIESRNNLYIISPSEEAFFTIEAKQDEVNNLRIKLNRMGVDTFSCDREVIIQEYSAPLNIQSKELE